MLTAAELSKLHTIQHLIDEMYEHYFEFCPDQHHKSGEGGIELYFGNVFQRRQGESKIKVSIYSYVFGSIRSPGRMHDFNSLDAALEEVRRWHAEEMAETYEGYSSW